jgi:hypothetical protein
MSCENDNPLVLTLLEAAVTLYPELTPGVADTANPVWGCACAESLRMSPRLLNIELTPTGTLTPTRKAIVVGHTIQFGKLWSLDRTEMETLPGSARYVLVIVWTEENTGTQRTRTYTGVTLDAETIGSRDRMESEQEITLAAETLTPTGGTAPGGAEALTDEEDEDLTDENGVGITG